MSNHQFILLPDKRKAILHHTHLVTIWPKLFKNVIMLNVRYIPCRLSSIPSFRNSLSTCYSLSTLSPCSKFKSYSIFIISHRIPALSACTKRWCKPHLSTLSGKCGSDCNSRTVDRNYFRRPYKSLDSLGCGRQGRQSR